MVVVAYVVELTEYAEGLLVERVTSERVLEKIEHTTDLLSQYPALGRAYDPQYAVAVPPFPCRCMAVADTPFALYYLIDDEAQTMVIISIEWSAGDPTKRFMGLY